MPASNETRVRSDGLSKSTATERGPGQRLVPVPVGLHRGGQVEHRGLLGRGEVVVAQEVPGHAREPACSRVQGAGSAATNASAWSAVRISGGASRITSGCTGLTRKPASRRAAATAAGDRRR